MNTPARFRTRPALVVALTLLEYWAVAALIGALLLPWLGARRGWERSEEELVLMGARYLGGVGLYVGACAAAIRACRHSRGAAEARAWRARCLGFHFVVLQICALGGLLGAIVFPVVGTLAGAHKSVSELIVLGTKTGGFFFLVWAPGAALVRMFMRAAREKSAAQTESEARPQTALSS